MKTKLIFKTAALVVFFFLSNAIRSQAPACNYQVSNPTACPANVTVDFYNSGGSLCKSISGGVPSGSSAMFNCSPGCSGTLSDIRVTLNWIISPTNTSGIRVHKTDIDASGSVSNACNGSSNVTLHWGYNETVIGQ